MMGIGEVGLAGIIERASTASWALAEVAIAGETEEAGTHQPAPGTIGQISLEKEECRMKEEICHF
jgi:hypothetical protein